ncbi:MAG TPA: pilin [Candidatus Saccharimonadales bacterium]|nr:pilin [Candidatus Saccharimonadales bacterium]
MEIIRRTLQRSTYLIASLAMFAVFFGAGGLVAAQQPQADPQQETPNIQASTCQGAELKFPTGQVSPDACAFTGNEPENKLNDLIATIVNLFSVVVGVVAVIMIIVGGFRYVTSGGDSGNVSSAKNTILYAIVGLVIVALAQFIVKFVLSKATGS